ncbi:sugar O-acetyltransferase [Oscillospiraceae bacterium 50-16]|nr:sugar O-acetyltransferase [Lawsonibacter sp.]
MDIREKQHGGFLYLPGDESLQREQLQCLDRLHEFNQLRPSQLEEKAAMLQKMFAEIGEDCYIETPLHTNFGGRYVHFGKKIYANFNLTLVDDTHIYVGDFCQIGPNVVLATAGHPIDPALREQGLQFNAPIRVGRNCWLGAGVLVMPGVTIGDNTVVGAGSVVTKDLPSHVVAVGNPCRVLREINDHDREYYFKDRPIRWEEFS